MLQDEENERTSKFQASVDIRGEISVKESTFGGHHQVAHGEVRAFTHFINNELKDDVDLKKHLPMNLENDELYDSVQDGLILCKLVNKCKPGTISEKAINKTKLDVIFRQRENVQLAIISAASIGCHVISITPITISQRKEHIILGLIWQLLKKIAFSQVNLKEHPDLAGLLRPGETIEDLMNLSPEELLKRWVNYHLDNDEKYSGKGIDNFGNDLKDSQAYISLLNQIQPGDLSPKFNHNAQGIPGDKERAQAVHDMAKRLDCGDFITADDIVEGNERVNLLFTATLFNNFPALDKVEVPEEVNEIDVDTPEERTFKNWMNSLEVDPYVNNLYSQLRDGGIILQLEDKIRPGIVNWKRVNPISSFKKLGGLMRKIENCNYAVENAKQLKCTVVNIQGSDLSDGNKKLTLAVVWQLMRAYTLKVLDAAGINDTKTSKEADDLIIGWCNRKLQSAGSDRKFHSFSDRSLSDSVTICHLINAIQPNGADLNNLGKNELENARYALSCARRIGARVYALPEDIVGLNRKMVMTVFACLMGCGMDTGVASAGDQNESTHRID